MQIKEFAEFSGVSVRTLHYYDEIGLLSPAYVDKNTGYRFYDEESVLRMQEILFYRELDFPLNSIMEILSSPNYDKTKALSEQKHLLTLKKERLERLIFAIDGAIKGENVMKAFDNTEFEKYKAEAKEKWGETSAYKEYENRGSKDSSVLSNNMADIFRRIGEIKESSPSSEEAQNLIKQLQSFITNNYYTCTDEILFSLGQMYVLDSRFTENIDNSGGTGTAVFTAEAIKIYCKK